ncbi:MAG: hypothetical protein GX951_02045 [Mollicutes bacterium]|nr:hypothetical protein [Mollicutes bacterium]
MKKTKEEQQNLYLVFVAIITMLVVLVGASFAYFSYNISREKKIATTLKTNASYQGDLTFNVSDDLNLYVDGENLNIADIGKAASKHITFKTSFYVNGPEIQRFYDVRLLINSNDLVYSSGVCKNGSGIVQPYDNRVDCENNSHFWTVEEIPELTLFIYKGTNKSSVECSNISRCINRNTLAITNPITCDGYVKKAIYENNVCYIPELSKNITENTTSENLYTRVKISSANGIETVHDYLAEVSLLNLSHNQKENHDKRFSGSLIFTSVSG